MKINSHFLTCVLYLVHQFNPVNLGIKMSNETCLIDSCNLIKRLSLKKTHMLSHPTWDASLTQQTDHFTTTVSSNANCSICLVLAIPLFFIFLGFWSEIWYKYVSLDQQPQKVCCKRWIKIPAEDHQSSIVVSAFQGCFYLSCEIILNS